MKIRVILTESQIERLLELLHAAFAGDTSEGDLSWTRAQHDSAHRAHQALIDARLKAHKNDPLDYPCETCRAGPGERCVRDEKFRSATVRMMARGAQEYHQRRIKSARMRRPAKAGRIGPWERGQ